MDGDLVGFNLDNDAPKIGILYNAANFLSEGVRYGASQKKRARDSTRGTARVLFTFWDVP